ncbi:MAG: hypothetical protein HC904_17745 [Blastochloris sp.]|nr:hypothetical protein [Blastochloris sp.]
MDIEGQIWIRQLREYIAACRTERPIKGPEQLTDEVGWQYNIIGSSFMQWLKQYGPLLIQERAVISDFDKLKNDPLIVFTGEEPGLVAAQHILRDESERVVYLHRDEYDTWEKGHPDPKFRWHIHTWSYFGSLDGEMGKRAREKYPLKDSETYWIHIEGTNCGELFGRGAEHLWKWDGEKPTLLEECFNRWMS